ncbi:Phm7p KNAG_0K00870 [Huiozyma naganishii CBS 8797]|uniref:DUF221-domain-containing protein n=1 Tax=Huiozyma naganishii (strain ATCC MYA-139 / BCRC 22969 / CBS 8797 / KCTC 17520 / NBRC 10181 / NCYC 3082 / Yp74L-3) TaxID=1071383 RepID=J7S371_HUIN7|nr:hypothetical protein KNAG_0K00870 [Kazachstania naganishii CBS 8797]CCK72452.1 hypothetical protein KNAG_0K00870 [Kazachstania naganishii CBS 8797]
MSADTSSSTSAFVTTLIVNSIVAAVFTGGFVLLRGREKRVYQPRTLADVQTITEEERMAEPPQGWFAWLPYLLEKSHAYLIQHCGIDGYFFLRYMGIFASFSVVCALLLFPILLPVNATNGHNLSGFEILSYANIKDNKRQYAHVFLSWAVYAFFMWVLYKELYYYTVMRHAVQTTPLCDGLLSSRTVVLTELDGKLMNEGELDKIFSRASRIVYAHDTKKLEKLVQERKKHAVRLETALNKVLDSAVGMTLEKKPSLWNTLVSKLLHTVRRESSKKGVLPGKGGSLGKPRDDLDTYVPLNKRPKHRTGPWYLPPMEWLFGRKKVNTLTYCKDEISRLNGEIHTLQDEWHENKKLPAVFLQFGNQVDAQCCFQSVDQLLGTFSFGKKIVGVAPEDINWGNLNLTRWERYARYIGANTFLTAMIIFWAIPTAVVGCISNVNFLTEKVPFLRFINNMPTFLLGIITGLLPTIALAVLMSLVPPIIKLAGNISGILTKQELGAYMQTWFYAFQVVQVFLVTTLASSASATVEQIINHPGDAMTLLANNLPKASNFYIVYFLLQGLSTPSGNLFQVVALIKSRIMGRFDRTPRQKWTRYNTLDKPDYALTYPTIQIFVCIFITYIMIAPIILVFSTFALLFMYVSFLYNANFVQGLPETDSQGRNYLLAMFQAMLPIYLCQVCLIGLFIMSKSWGPLVLEVVALAATAIAHVYFKWKYLPTIDCVPLSAIRIARGEIDSALYPAGDLGKKEISQLADREKMKYRQNTTGGVIRDATNWELRHANLLPLNDNSSNTLGTDSLGDLEKQKQAEQQGRKGSTITGRTVASTFVSEDEQFKKLTYDDVKDLQKLRSEAAAGQLGPYEVDDTAGVRNIADVGKVYSDVNAMKDAPEAFPPNIVAGVPWHTRIANFFRPTRAYPFDKIRSRLPHVYNTTVAYDDEYPEIAYTNPSVRDKDPIIWICKDSVGLSKQQIADAKDAGVQVSDEFTKYDAKGKSTYTFNPPDYEREVKR